MSREPDPPLQTCPNCDHAVPAGDFCGHCGAHLAPERQAGRRRAHAFAASPGEHVLQPSLISTFFPHLPERRHAAFRWALGAGTVLVLVLAGFRLFAPAAAVASVLLPALYFLYLFEARVWRDQPWLFAGGSFLVGALAGLLLAVTLQPAVTQASLQRQGLFSTLLAAAAVPLASQAAMLLGPILLLGLRRYDEVLDGLAFGVASALGFTLTTALISLSPLLAGPLLAEGAPQDWALLLLQHGLLAGLVNAAATGAVTTALWLLRHGRRARALPGAWFGVGPALAVALAVQSGLGLLAELPSLVLLDLLWAAAAVVLGLYLRLVVHHALLAEQAEHEIGPLRPCPECHRMVPAMRFCPACGVARRAGSRRPPAAAAEASAHP